MHHPSSLRRRAFAPLILAILNVVLTLSASTRAAENLDVLTPAADGTAPGKQLELQLKREFYAHVDRRSAAFEQMLKSEAACRAWQAERRAYLLDRIGGLPERTPLNARIVGKLPGEGYRIEKILFESRPSFHVAANLYLPEGAGPWPAVIVPCGHSHNGKAAGQYQKICILLARNGMAAFCYDPIGQGERYQILNVNQSRKNFEDAAHVPTPHPSVRYMCTTEHTLVGLGCALLGDNVAQYRIWDGMRAIDYLQSRADILKDKIGCCGNSGGGTETAYLMALDDRILAASPGCYLTTFRRLIDTKGPQDGEQNIFGQISFGLDEADYCIMRAPKPTLICAATRDATFDFRGTWELFLDAKRFYSRLGAAEKMEINTPDAPHGFTLQQREATARFMHRWLIGGDKPIREVENLPDTLTDVQLWSYSEPDFTARQLQCTPEGQVLLMPGERSTMQINAERAAKLRQERSTAWAKLSDDAKRALMRTTIGARTPADVPPAKAEIVAEVERDNCTIRKLVLTLDDDTRLPALAFVPKQPAIATTLYLHGASMKADAAPGGPIDALVAKGHFVLAAELRGIGETETGHGKSEFGRGRFGPDNLEIFVAYLIGKNFVGMRVDDIERWTRILRVYGKLGSAPPKLHLVAVGEAAVPALHHAALNPAIFHSVTLRRMVESWEAVVAAPETFDQSVNVVHGALRHYDLGDLLPLVGGDKVRITETVDPLSRPLQK
jgi:dienelactone hydrolase